jgi:hypothetical protein
MSRDGLGQRAFHPKCHPEPASPTELTHPFHRLVAQRRDSGVARTLSTILLRTARISAPIWCSSPLTSALNDSTARGIYLFSM